MPAQAIQVLFAQAAAQETLTLHVDLAAQTVSDGAQCWSFSIDGFRRHALLNGLDDIGQTLKHRDSIIAFETQHRARFPWLFTESEEHQS